ncbi:hypothetical protein LTR36_002083 [Oleoguttula mirabilis]|uniref:Uncharacterized protein n=1 Tax=Oleoguttula mirabilis TaxID=1507867 RepID=A0AAV9JLN2_9PEZI|nr:hypothetical protein LTR36_002083 [Oleoguttula mirabilis]
MGIPFGHDDAADIRSAPGRSPGLAVVPFKVLLGNEDRVLLPAPEKALSVAPEPADASDDEDDYFQVPIPTSSTGTTMFAYQLALQNRIKNGKLVEHGEYDMRAYKPTFIHDSLMLPGSLANFLGKRHAKNLVPKMTPALLPGFHAYVHSDTQMPCILQSPNATDYVQGMVVFGQVDVHVDVAVSVPVSERDYPTEHWRLKRRVVSGHAWIWSNVGSGDVLFRTQYPRWTLEDYIDGNLAPQQALRIGDACYLKDEVTVIVTDDDEGKEDRKVVYGGCGPLDSDRGHGFTGW